MPGLQLLASPWDALETGDDAEMEEVSFREKVLEGFASLGCFLPHSLLPDPL